MSALSDAIELQPMPDIDAQTRLYAVFGNPVAHSLSPVMHNCAFKRIGHNGIYVALRVRDIAAAVSAVRCLSIQGVSVTVPHKTAVIPLLDRIDSLALDIGAVNTILNQGVLQFERWTGKPAPLEVMRQVVREALTGKAEANGSDLKSERPSA